MKSQKDCIEPTVSHLMILRRKLFKNPSDFFCPHVRYDTFDRIWLINIEFTRQTFLNSLFENLLVTFKANFEHNMTKVCESKGVDRKKAFELALKKRFRMLSLQNTESKKDMKSIVLC